MATLTAATSTELGNFPKPLAGFAVGIDCWCGGGGDAVASYVGVRSI